MHKDVSFRIIPVDQKDAYEMIKEIKGYPLLHGYRGREPVSLDVLVEMILKISNFVRENSFIRYLELNPIFAYEDSAVVVDARIILEN
jgi:acetyl-CoA synthetase (ADP-forming)